jgi:hypothetical protein
MADNLHSKVYAICDGSFFADEVVWLENFIKVWCTVPRNVLSDVWVLGVHVFATILSLRRSESELRQWPNESGEASRSALDVAAVTARESRFFF